MIDVSEHNPELTGIYSNKIVYTGFNFKRGRSYRIDFPEGAALSDQTFGADANHKYSIRYSAATHFDSSESYIQLFLDVKEDNWAYSYVKELTEKRVINGYEDGTFRPNNHVTRSEFAKMMVAALHIPASTDGSRTFIDVPFDRWDYEYVEAAKHYLTGFFDGQDYYFKGNEPAVREDLAVALVNVLGLKDQSIDVSELEGIFIDYSSISSNLASYVLIAHQNGIIEGYPDNTFRAQQPITRAEAAALITRVLNLAQMEKMTFDDQPEIDSDDYEGET